MKRCLRRTICCLYHVYIYMLCTEWSSSLDPIPLSSTTTPYEWHHISNVADQTACCSTYLSWKCHTRGDLSSFWVTIWGKNSTTLGGEISRRAVFEQGAIKVWCREVPWQWHDPIATCLCTYAGPTQSPAHSSPGRVIIFKTTHFKYISAIIQLFPYIITLRHVFF